MADAGEPGWRSVGELLSIGTTMVAATVIGLGAGYLADRWLGTGPWFTLVGLALGIAASFVSLFRAVRAAERNLDERR